MNVRHARRRVAWACVDTPPPHAHQPPITRLDHGTVPRPYRSPVPAAAFNMLARIAAVASKRAVAASASVGARGTWGGRGGQRPHAGGRFCAEPRSAVVVGSKKAAVVAGGPANSLQASFVLCSCGPAPAPGGGALVLRPSSRARRRHGVHRRHCSPASRFPRRSGPVGWGQQLPFDALLLL
jgi:hypothetical protein